MRSRRLAVVAVLMLLACPAGQAPAQLPARPATPTGPTLRVGALLPLTGPGAWFGAEIKQALELAVAELDPAPRRGVSTTGGGADSGTSTPAAAEGESKSESARETGTGTATTPPPPAGETAGAAGSSETKKAQSRPPAEPVEPADRPRTLALVVQALDVQPLDVRDAESEFTRLLGSGVVAIMTASPTPTLAIYPLAAARDILVLHAGLATERFPATSRVLFQLRPSAAARADVLAAHAWVRGIRRLAVLTGGDAFGRATRAAAAARWRQQGGHLVHEESLSLDASDLRPRLRAVVRDAPEAVVLGFQGTALGEAARVIRDAGYAGQLLAIDDDRAARLAGGRALDGALVLADAFVPLPGTRGARFARAYEAKHGQPPSRFAANAYEAATLLAEAAERSLREGRGVSGTRLRSVLTTGGPFTSLYAGDLVVRDDGTVARPLALFRADGESLAFETYVGLDGRAVSASPGSTP
jgi:ABC-type branched-subunit amino acid transport system substrate-binding protein